MGRRSYIHNRVMSRPKLEWEHAGIAFSTRWAKVRLATRERIDSQERHSGFATARRLATQIGDRRPATGDRRPATGDRRPATGDRRPACYYAGF
jgi:hypothetical protein